MRPRRGLASALDDVDAKRPPPGGSPTARSQGEITHLALDAAGDDAPATGAHPLRAEFVEHELPGPLVTRLVLRGEWLPHGAACGG